jgi:cellulose synthase/poly-beta-1,6-N-acetylglucosamine synthase-like glycosyltransferase
VAWRGIEVTVVIELVSALMVMNWFPTYLNSLQQLVLLLVTVVTGLVAIYASNIWILSILSIRGRKLPNPPKTNSWPVVSVHLPLYNEETVAGRLLNACVNFDYPRDKLEIVVVDDSTDRTTDVVREFENLYPDLVKVIHRDNRIGFKGGALQVAMEHSKGDLICLFDADYAPPRNFLKEMIPYLSLDQKAAFVQARWTYDDGQFSWFAKAVSLAIDIYGFVDQKARSIGNLLAHFSGTCGVFRRQAIEDVGGWSADSVTEDLDLSIRLHLKGWRYIYVPTVACAGEIPRSFLSLKLQQFRWARGYSECLRRYSGAILRSRQLTFFQKLEAILHLGTYFVCPLTIIGIVVGLLYYSIFPPSFWLEGYWKFQVAWLTLLLSIVTYTSPFIASAITLSELSQSGMSKLRRLLHLGYLGAVLYGLMLSNTKAAIEGLLFRASSYHRTPKLGSVPRTQTGNAQLT